MVYLHFPNKLTEEEVMLQNKYHKLRKKKKALEELKAAADKPKVEPVNPLKRQLDPKDAKELAKKLIKTGKVLIAARPLHEKTTFKRSRVLERRMGQTPRPEATPFHLSSASAWEPPPPTPGGPSSAGLDPPLHFEPFTPSTPTPTTPTTAGDSPTGTGTGGSGGGHRQFSFSRPGERERDHHRGDRRERESPVSSSDEPGSRESPGGGGGGGGMKPKRGQTIYIYGHQLSEHFLRDNFGKFGKIINVKMGSASTGFLTFEKVENAEVALTEMNGSTVDDTTLTVEFARKQPSIHSLINDAGASATWTALASSQSMKGTHMDKRQALVYEDIL